MRRRFLSLSCCALALLLLLSGCGGGSSNTQSTSTSASSIAATPTPNPTPTAEPTPTATKNDNLCQWHYFSDFHDGLAWVVYSDEITSKKYSACIDKFGTMVFRVPYGCFPTAFENGYAYLSTENSFIVINSLGDIINSYPIDSVKCYGGGYVVTEENIANFDVNEYIYRFHDIDGSVIEEFTLTDGNTTDEFFYCGKGVFRYREAEYGSFTVFSASKGWKLNMGDIKSIKKQEFGDRSDKLYFYSDYAVIGYTSYIGEEGYFQRHLVLLDTDKNLYRTVSPTGFSDKWDYKINDIEYILIKNGESLSSYNNVTGAFGQEETSFPLPSKYADQVIWNHIPEDTTFDENRVALPLLGADNKKYVGIFDTQWNLISEPILAEEYTNFSDGRLILSDGEGNCKVYDTEGKIVYRLDETYSTVSNYSEGLVYVQSYLYGNRFLDTEGNTVISENSIDTSSVKDISI